MKRERVEKGIARMNDFYSRLDDSRNPLDFYDSTMLEAFTRTMMDFEPEELDYETAKWFIEDEEEYKKAEEQAYKNVKATILFVKKLNHYYDELEKEETNETCMENC